MENVERVNDVSFVATLRKAGASGASLLVTVPKDVVRLLGLNAGDMVNVKIRLAKAKKPT